jgi:L-threonylcarbamoyladenylate synthase
MEKIFRNFSKEAARILRRGGVGVVPTDTLYGISASVFCPEAIARIYRLRKRNPKKPLIILISSLGDLKKLGIYPKPKTYKLITNLWPGKVSVVLPCRGKKFSYLHRGTKTLAVRLPQNARLRSFLRKTGPLVSTSVNPEGLPPAKTVSQARRYFGDELDFYIDAGRLDSPPSTLVSFVGGKVKVLRRGAAKIKERQAANERTKQFTA